MMSLKVAVIIPCRNEEKYISSCLDSLVNCKYPKSLLEVYVCDGMSTDATVGIIREYATKYSFIHLLENTRKTTQFALNMGINHSDADIKIILGAHAEILPDYIEKCLLAFAVDESIGCVGGTLENVVEDKISGIISNVMSSGFGVGNAYFRTGAKDGYVDTVAFGAYKNEVFNKIGLFDEDLVRNQDDEFNFRVLKGDFKIYLSREIKARYYVRASYDKLFRQYFQYGYWKVYVNVKHKTVTTLRQMVPLFFVLFLIFGSGLSLFNGLIFKVFLFILLCYFMMGSISAIKRGRSLMSILQMLGCFFLLHVSYGWGYLLGIVHFIVLKKNISNKYASLTR